MHLTPNKYKFLALLVKHAGMVVTHRQILREGGGRSTSRKLTTCGCIWGN